MPLVKETTYLLGRIANSASGWLRARRMRSCVARAVLWERGWIEYFPAPDGFGQCVRLTSEGRDEHAARTKRKAS